MNLSATPHNATVRQLGTDSPANSLTATVADNAMYPCLKQGDTVHIDPNRTEIVSGKKYAYAYGGNVFFRQLEQLPNHGVKITSENKAEFADLFLTPEQMAQHGFKVIGWIWAQERLEVW